MKTVNVQIGVRAAESLLEDMEQGISVKRNELEELREEIEEMEASIKSLKASLQESGVSMRAPRGDNRQKIIDYLSSEAGRKASRISDIANATNIGVSSTNFTLTNYTDDFVKDEATKTWKLKSK